MSGRQTWLVAGQAAYLVLYSDEENVNCKIEAGSDRVREREVVLPRVQVQAAIDLGEMRSTRKRPAMIDEQLATQTASKLDQEAALATTGDAEGKKKAAPKKGKVRDRLDWTHDNVPREEAGALADSGGPGETDESPGQGLSDADFIDDPRAT